MPTKTTCRLGSDVDLLSRVQAQDVLSLLGDRGADESVGFVVAADNATLKASRTHPKSPARVAIQMNALIGGEWDALVVDATAVPVRLPAGLTIGALTPRLTPYDALISADGAILDELPENAVLAADEPRRVAQMLDYRPDLRVVNARGSLDSLIQKVRGENIDAAVVSAADMERIGKQEYVVELLTNAVCVPAAGQGALAVLVRSRDDRYKENVQCANDTKTYRELTAEWAFLARLGLECVDPVGVMAIVEGMVLEIEGVLAFPDGREKIHFMVKGSVGQEDELGRTLAEEILAAGGAEIIQELHLS